MEENEIQQSQNSDVQSNEPAQTENSLTEKSENSIVSSKETTKEGQSNDPSSELILGKFKSIEDLSNAYSELQKKQGENSQELGTLRKTVNSVNDFSETLKNTLELSSQLTSYLNEYREKYNTPEYFQDNSFRAIYKEAFKVLGQNLDSDKFISLLEDYVGSRISAYEKSKSAKAETDSVLSSMTYEKNEKSSLIPPKKDLMK